MRRLAFSRRTPLAGRPQPPIARRLAAPRLRLATLAVVLLSVLSVAFPDGLPAQQSTARKLRQQREELDRIRAERAALRKRMGELQGNVHDLSAEVRNLDRQADVTGRMVRSLDQQLLSISNDVGDANARLVRTQDELALKQAVLRRRLVDIYKRGPLYSVEVLLSAQSFGQLVARYKYLHLVALRDRALLHRVEALRDRITGQKDALLQLHDALEQNRQEKEQEERQLRSLEQQRTQSLAQARAQAKQTQTRLARAERAEKRLTSVIASIETARRRAEARASASRGAAPSVSTLRTSDLGRLAWPVEGEIIYRFGRVINPNKTTTRWNGIGIGAASGTPVRAIADGQVAVADQIGTYGLTVIVQHGGGDYSVYGSLARAEVRQGARVRKGQTIGTVGAADPDLPAHLHFEIRRSKGTAVDPLSWLRGGGRQE